MLYFSIFINSSEPKAEINNAFEILVIVVALLIVNTKGRMQGQKLIV